MTRKLRTILRDYGERVAISNSLVLDILNAYMKKSEQLKKAEKKIEKYEKQLSAIQAILDGKMDGPKEEKK